MALIQTVHLSMANFKSAPVVPAVQNDTDRQLKMIIDDYTLTSGLTGKIAFERSDGTHYETAAELVLADNAFTADIDQALTQPGRTMVQLKVTDVNTVSTFSFVVFVEADNSGTVTPQEGIDLVTAVEAAEDAADRAESAASEVEDLAYLPNTIAPEFSTSADYTAGDYVFYNGHLYRFSSAHSAGAWSAAEAVEVDVTSEIDRINKELEFSVDYINLGIAGVQGGFSGDIGDTITFNTQSAWARKSFAPEYGTTYKIVFWNRTNISARAYIYAVDSNNKILYKYGEMPAQQADFERQEVVVAFPAGVHTVWVCGSNNAERIITIYKIVEKSIIDNIQSDIDEINDIIHDTSPYNNGVFSTYRDDFVEFYKGRNNAYDDGTEFNSSTLYSTIISKFDALMAMDSAHISKNALGTASGTDGNGNPYTIYEYVFMPHAYKPSLLVQDASLLKNPVILLDASIHGFEKNSTYGLYYFLYDLINNYYDDHVLTAIRDNIVLKVIPVSNPYGFDRDLYNNANDVNINRNFATSDWSAGDNTGDAPFDQPESVIIRDWVEDNLDDLMAYYNLHTNGRRYVSAWSDANSCMAKFSRSNDDAYYARLAYVIQRHIQMQSSYFSGMYTDFPNNSFIGKYQAETGSVGLASIWAVENDIMAMTFETFNGIKINDDVIVELFSANSKKICSEMLGNMIAQTVLEFSTNRRR